MRQPARLGIEYLESRFAPASLTAFTGLTSMASQQAVPTVPVLGGLASSPLGVAKVEVSHIQPELDDDI